MANTYVLVGNYDISSPTAGVTFSDIPQTYTDLILRVTSRMGTSGTSAWLQVRVNGSTSTYYEVYGYNTGSGSDFGAVGPQSSLGASGWIQTTAGGQTQDVFGVSEIYIPNYTKNASINQVFGALAYKQTADASTGGGNTFMAGAWATTTAISSIYVFGSSNFQAGSRIYLYAVKNS
jgi:hypothetical protein